MKYLIILVLLFFPPVVMAAQQNYVTWIFPVRGREYWRQEKDISQLTDLTQLVDQANIPATWLLHYDTLLDPQIVQQLKSMNSDQELGLFLEVTRKLALDSRVNYDWESEKWERADKVFLSGYQPEDRVKLIDMAMTKFKQVYGYYPTSVGAWYIDGRSLVYLKQRYGVEAVLGVADQYVTDGYQIWGQYIGEPYYPSLGSVIEPALNKEDKIDVVKLQWAPREPLLSYGSGGEFSNFSAQANDFGRAKNLGLDYFANLVETYTTEVEANLAQVTLGIEVGELQQQYLPLVAGQMQVVKNLSLTPLSMSNLAQAYKDTYPDVSPPLIISSTLGDRSITWFQSPKLRYAILTEAGRSDLVDMRYYHTSRYFENDWNEADKRQNLYRVVPAVVDQVAQIKSVDMATPSAQVAVSPGQVSVTDRLRRWLGMWIPDLRASKLSGRWVFGWAKDAQTLCLVHCQAYPYPIMAAFLNLDRWRQPQVKWYGRWQDQLGDKMGAVIKNAPYGLGPMTEELSGAKLFENSYLLIHK